ncbi:NB-ARC domain protein [Candidatus Tiddalikarchaeum anstoanum]|nr:NB-ARC domain protein [Candidatus Tiddalikarchaeum anstoanum]
MLNDVIRFVKKNFNVCIVGEYGIGKTFILQKISRYFKAPILDANPTVESLNKLLCKDCSSKKEAYSILLRRKRMVLLFDDIHESRKDTLSMIIRLCKKHTIIAASEKEIEKLNYEFQNMNIRHLNRKESVNLCKKFGIKDYNIITRISNNSKGLPLLIIRGVEYYKITGEIKNYIPNEWKKDLLKKIVITAYLCLSLRYLSRFNHLDFYSVLSIFGYIMLAFNRYNKKI